MTNFLSGYKTYIACAGFVVKALSDYANGDTASMVNSLLAALALFGVRSAIANGK